MKLKYFKLMDKEERAEYDYRFNKKIMSHTAYSGLNSLINFCNMIFIATLSMFTLASYDQGKFGYMVTENLPGFMSMLNLIFYYYCIMIGYSFLKEIYLWYREHKIVGAIKKRNNLKGLFNGGIGKWITEKKKKI